VFGLPAPAYAGWTPKGGIPAHLAKIQERWPTAPPEIGRALIAAQTPKKPEVPAAVDAPAAPAALPPVAAPPPAATTTAGERVPTPVAVNPVTDAVRVAAEPAPPALARAPKAQP
jgi:hypothetical protein